MTGLAIDSVAVTITDDDPGVTISESMISLTEGGEDASYTVALNTRPSSNVVITVGKTGSDSDALTVDTDADTARDQDTLTFSNATGEMGGWDRPQSVTLSPEDDSDGDRESVMITHSITSSEDTAYHTGLAIAGLTVTVTDPGVTISESTLSLTEGGADGSYTVVLNARPSGNVVITVGNPDTDALTVDTDADTANAQDTLTFSNATGEMGGWDRPQSVTLSPEEDSAEVNKSVALTHSITSSEDAAYPTTGLAIAGLTVTVTDTTDTDGDGMRNAVDTDDDNDGINDFMADGMTALDPQRLIPDCGGTPTMSPRTQDGTAANPYCIDTLAELQSIDGTFANSYTTGQSPAVTVTTPLTKHYRLTANIDAWPTNNGATANPRTRAPQALPMLTAAPQHLALTSATTYGTAGFDPIGGTFSGTFEGGGYTIHGLKVTGSARVTGDSSPRSVAAALWCPTCTCVRST